jgi:3-deoxy-manno-octulosonate cytidylyltransferase (CMP-KDO synthetase)
LKTIILIPVRLNSKRLPHKALLEIEKIPLIIHTYLRSKMSKLADEVYVCTDSNQIIEVCKKFNAKFIKTKSIHKNGTERIAEAVNKIKVDKNDIIIDVQGDEPLINPKHIDKVIKFFKSNKYEIVVPHIKINDGSAKNIVKLIVSKKNKILWMTRSQTPFNFYSKDISYLKHLSIIAFNKISLKKYSAFKISNYEKIESIELLRAIENDMSLGSFPIKTDSFSIDVLEDFIKAKKFFLRDKIKLSY